MHGLQIVVQKCHHVESKFHVYFISLESKNVACNMYTEDNVVHI